MPTNPTLKTLCLLLSIGFNAETNSAPPGWGMLGVCMTDGVFTASYRTDIRYRTICFDYCKYLSLSSQYSINSCGVDGNFCFSKVFIWAYMVAST